MSTKRLKRSKKERIIAGVCGGLAEYYKIDASMIRIAFVLAFVFAGIGLLPYLVLWLIMPER
ncbi:MAG: PspC domain-containing protein [Deinococcota bacterium]|jgi:phage shock protein C|nr:PspC domain-containing protein [Deinococcota bacterium]